MHRSLAALLALSAASGEAFAQGFQFRPFAPRERVSLLPSSGFGDVLDGDLDGDGIDDLILAYLGGVRVLLSSVGGSPPQILPTTGSVRLVLVDLDSDGDLDAVCAARSLAAAGPVQVFRNSGGTLSPHTLPWGYAQGAAVGDVDGNGFADLVLATPVGQAAAPLVLARGGPGVHTLDTVSMPPGLPYGLWPELMDADGDGDLDVLATHATSGLRLLRNQGGTFVDATTSLPPARTGHVFLASADFDADGLADCFATLANGDVDVLWGGSAGLTFRAAVANVPAIQRLWPADFDGDGDLDLLAQHAAGLDVLWNLGNRQFARESVVAEQTMVQGVPDLDDDGRTDVVFATLTSPLWVRCKFAARIEDAAFAVGLAPFTSSMLPLTAPLPGDVDSDGRTDVVYVGHDFVCVDRALGGGAYRRSAYPLPSSPIGNTWTAKLADLDADGDLDVVAKSHAALIVADNTGSGAYVGVLQRTSAGQAKDCLRVGDVDGDGDRDIVFADNGGIALVLNLGQAQYAPTAILAPAPARCVELADVDGDDDLDVVTDAVTASGLSHLILANDGRGTFTPNAAFYLMLGSAPMSVCARDLDGDGDADLVADDGRPRVYRNDGSGVFSDRTPFDLPTTTDTIASNFAIADVDDDGDLDVSALTTGAPTFLLLLNDGSGRFADHSAPRVQFGQPAGTASWRLVAGDFDDDGDVDFTIGAFNYRSFLVNHVRQCASNAVPRLGGIADLHLHSGPGFSTSGVGLLGVGFALATPPLTVPGLRGRLHLDPSTLQIVAAVTTSSIGVSSAFVAVPQDSALFGLEVWFQGAILPATGQPGFTNAVYEVVLR